MNYVRVQERYKQAQIPSVQDYTQAQVAKIKLLAEFQEVLSIYTVSVEWHGQHINNPWLDPTRNIALSDKTMIEYYGANWVAKWFAEARKWIDEKSDDPF